MSNNKKAVFITYSSDNEIIITKPKYEQNTIRLYFNVGGRDIEEYDREEHFDEAFVVRARVAI